MIEVSEICEKLNDQAATLAPQLLPNGHRSGNKWMASGIADTGRSASLYVHLSGPKIGHWYDMGNAAPGEDKGDMLDLIRLKECGGDVASAVAQAKSILGIHDEFVPGVRHKPNPEEMARRAEEARVRAEQSAAREADERAAKTKRAMGLFLSGKPIEGTPAEAYLRGRSIVLPHWPGSLRFHPEVWHKDERCKLPAMLAGIFNHEGRQIGTHRTFLQQLRGRWVKYQGEHAKLVLGSMWGGFVPIARGSSDTSMRHMVDGEPVYVTEGIEDACVVSMILPAARVVAAISLPNIGGLVLPAAAKELIAVCDRDENEKAQAQLERAIAQQQARGLSVRMVMPPAGIKDVNDWWQEIRRGVQAA